MSTSAIQTGQFCETAPGIRLHYASAGKRGAPLMLFLHGFPQAWFEWEAQLAHFGENYFAIAPDLRGFNLSSKPADVKAYRASHIVADLKALIGALGYKSAVVVAHDWGGAIAWNLAIFEPALVERLIIINAPHPWLFMRDLQHDAKQIAASAYMNMLRGEGSETFLSENQFARLEASFSDDKGQRPPWYERERERYHAMWSIPGDGGTHGLTGAINYYRASPLRPGVTSADHVPKDPDMWKVKVPTRVIWAEGDRALLPNLLNGLDDFVVDLKITRLPVGSHWIIQEEPQAITQYLDVALRS